MLSPTSTRHPLAHFEIGLRPSRRLSSVVKQQTETESWKSSIHHSLWMNMQGVGDKGEDDMATGQDRRAVELCQAILRNRDKITTHKPAA